MTGIGTVLADDPELTARLDDGGREILQPVRVVLDSNLRFPVRARLAKTPGRTVILTTRRAHEAIPGVAIVTLPADRAGRLDLLAVIGWLAGQAFNEVLFECGPTLSGALLREQLIDEWLIYMAPVVLGDAGRGLFHLQELTRMADRFELSLREIRQVGRDVRLRFAGAGNVEPGAGDAGG